MSETAGAHGARRRAGVRGQHAERLEEGVSKAVVSKDIFGTDKDNPLIKEGAKVTVHTIPKSQDVVVTFHPFLSKDAEPEDGSLPRAVRLTKAQAKNLKKV